MRINFMLGIFLPLHHPPLGTLVDEASFRSKDMNDEGEFASANTTTRVVGSIEPYTVFLESHRLKLPTSDIMTIDDTTVLQIIRGLHDSRLSESGPTLLDDGWMLV